MPCDGGGEMVGNEQVTDPGAAQGWHVDWNAGALLARPASCNVLPVGAAGATAAPVVWHGDAAIPLRARPLKRRCNVLGTQGYMAMRQLACCLYARLCRFSNISDGHTASEMWARTLIWATRASCSAAPSSCHPAKTWPCPATVSASSTNAGGAGPDTVAMLRGAADDVCRPAVRRRGSVRLRAGRRWLAAGAGVGALHVTSMQAGQRADPCCCHCRAGCFTHIMYAQHSS